MTGCVIRSVWGALKLGTESAGDFRNIVFSDLVIRDTQGGGLKIISMDGCVLENVHVSNIVMDRVSGPIFLRLGRRLRRYFADQPERPPGRLRHVSIRNVTARVWEEGYPLFGQLPRKAGIIVTGVPGHDIEDVSFENIDITFPGGGSAGDAARHDVPEQEDRIPRVPDVPSLARVGVLPAPCAQPALPRRAAADGATRSAAGVFHRRGQPVAARRNRDQRRTVGRRFLLPIFSAADSRPKSYPP